MHIERGDAHTKYAYWTVRVDPGELVVASGKTLPYGTWIGTIQANGKISVWSPATSKPRGYREAALRMLETARGDLINEGKVKSGHGGRGLTIAQAKAKLRLAGIVLRKTEYGEYRVNFHGGDEDTAYYASDLQDAVDTGLAMASEGRRFGGRK